MKLALGTAQFGSNYGIANTEGCISTTEATKIFRSAHKYGIDTLDTAILYGDSESALGAIGVQSWKIITKLPLIPKESPSISQWIRRQVLNSMLRLGVKKLYGLLLHRPDQLLENIGLEIYNVLVALRDEGVVDKIGISIYATSELDLIFDKYDLEIVQAPLNILDRSLINSGWGIRLKNAGVELHVRSIFLQGLLLMPPYSRPPSFNRWSETWKVWDSWIESTGLSPLQACLSYVADHDCVDKIIVGIDSAEHLNQIVGLSLRSIPYLPFFSDLKDDKLVNPSKWDLK
jgi:aryl-alcohol dehydrogenase-like predicted oxidoreductase